MNNEIVFYPENKKWSKTFKFLNIDIRFGVYFSETTSSFFIEKFLNKENYKIVNQHIFEKIYYGERIRLVHHSRKKILKKQNDG